MYSLKWMDIRALFCRLSPAEKQQFIAYLRSLQDTGDNSTLPIFCSQEETQNIG